MPCTTDLIYNEVNHVFNMEIDMPEPTMVKFLEESIKRPEHLVELSTEDANNVAEALRKPGGFMPSSDGARAVHDISPLECTLEQGP